jgi:hypothetical protein
MHTVAGMHVRDACANVLTHALTNTHTHTVLQTHVRAHTHTHTNTHTVLQTHVRAHTHTHTNTRTRTSALSLSHTHTHTPTCLQNEEDAYRKIKLRVEDVQGRNCLTNFWVSVCALQTIRGLNVISKIFVSHVPSILALMLLVCMKE